MIKTVVVAASLLACAGSHAGGAESPATQEQANQSPCAQAAAKMSATYEATIAAGKTITDQERHAMMKQTIACQK